MRGDAGPDAGDFVFAWIMTTSSPQSTGGDGASAADARLPALTASLAARLRAVCRDWDAAEFDALVERIARTKLRWADRGDGG